MAAAVRQTALDKCSYGLYIVTSHLDGKLNGQITDARYRPPRRARPRSFLVMLCSRTRTKDEDEHDCQDRLHLNSALSWS